MIEPYHKIPDSWVFTKLEDIGKVVSGGTPSTKNDENFNGDIAWLTPSDLTGYKEKFIERGKRNVSEKGLKTSSAVLVPKGTILFSSRAPIGYIVIAQNPISTNQGFKNLITSKEVFNEYIYYYLKANKNLAESYSSGTTFKEISASNFKKLPIPLPPFNEQNRIVLKIEELFTQIDAGLYSLNKAKLQLNKYRQSVLKSAYEGKLTERWREEHTGELESASVLTGRIKEKSKKTDKKNRELITVNENNLTELPKIWSWVRLSDIVEDIIKKNPKQNPNIEFFYLDIGAIDNTNQTLKDAKKYLGKDAPSRARQFIKSGDILFSTVRTYLKNIAMVNEIYDGQIASTGFCVIRPYYPINKNFIFYFVQTEQFLKPLNKIQRGTSYPAVRNSDVLFQIIPLPPEIEQNKIVEKIDNSLSIVYEIDNDINYNLIKSMRLKQSILKKAFEGKLVPQDPNDEPAEILLERIKAEKAKIQKEKKTRKKINQKVLDV